MKKILLFISAIVMLFGCESENLLHPYGPDDSTPPGPVTDVIQSPIPGGVMFKYSLPKDKDLSYVKAVYYINGVALDTRASQYNKELKLEGLPNSDDYDVILYAVDKSENLSAPTTITIKPGDSPVKVMRESLKYEVDFGGFKIHYKNPSRSELSLYVLLQDSLSPKMNLYEARVFTQEEGFYQVIGLPNITNKFAILVRDKFNNTSDSLVFVDRPWREEYFNKKKFKYIGAPQVIDPDDWYAWMGSPYNLWNDVVGEWDFAQTAGNSSYPHYLCIDLGKTMPIGRVRLQLRSGNSNIFYLNCVKKFELWGAAKLPPVNKDKPFEGWTKLDDNLFEVIRPSGLNPGDVPTTEDIQAAEKGLMFTISGPFPRPEVRYVRFNFTESFTGNMALLSEVSFWAQWK